VARPTKGIEVSSDPNMTTPSSPAADPVAAAESSETASAETAPVALPGAPPPPTHEAAEAGHELAAHGADALTVEAAAGRETESAGPAVSTAVEPNAEEDADSAFAVPIELIDETVAPEDLKFEWYILKVQVNREDSIKDALWRRVKMNGVEPYFKEIVVPTEDVVEFTKAGKRKVVKRKLYPGYILVNMAVSDESWFVVRETSGIGDFTGSAGKPTPMEPKDVERILRSSKVLPEEEGAGVKTTIPFKVGDRVRVKEGYFQNFEGDVSEIDEAHGRVKVMINIFGRATPVEIDHWQIEAV
jgi:transcriptional antiterminator NusG